MSRTIDSELVEQTLPSSDHDVVYVGYRHGGRTIVEKLPEHERLTPEQSLELASHSPTGFEWGYGGSGPAQLALAILLDYTDDQEVALAHYTEFKTEVVSQLDCDSADGRWQLTDSDIDAALRKMSDEAVAPSI